MFVFYNPVSVLLKI